jgi:hypothetical protein
MKIKKALFYLLAVILGGCVPVMSLHPLYTEKELVFEEKLLGTWIEDSNTPENTWEFKNADEEDKTYTLIFTDNKGDKGSFQANLTKLGNYLFLDVYPDETPWDEDDPNKLNWVYNTLFLIPAHSFIKVDITESVLKLQITDDDELKKLLLEKPTAVKHTFVDNKPVLIAQTKDLQAFVTKYVDDNRLFPDSEAIICRKAK